MNEIEKSSMDYLGLNEKEFQDWNMYMQMPLNEWPQDLKDFMTARAKTVGACGDVMSYTVADWIKSQKRQYNMRLWVCTRVGKFNPISHSPGWNGALIIGAETEQEAIDLYKAQEDDDEPDELFELKPRRGTLYNDEMR